MSRSDKIIVQPGTKFNHLTFLEEAEPYITPSSGHKITRWKCQCDCKDQTIIITRAVQVRNGHTKSCGCLAKEKAKQSIRNNHKKNNLTGQQIGYLKILKETLQRKNNEIVWECQCCYPKMNNTLCKNIVYLNSSEIRESLNCGNHNIRSRGEEKIIFLLDNANIPYEKEKRFETCLSYTKQSPLRFDFFVNKEYIIEYDGEQHFNFDEKNPWFPKDKWEEMQRNDKIKNQWCKENNIPIIRIPYTQYSQLCLEDLLLETSRFVK